MQLAPGEHSILATFPSSKRAQSALEDLKEAGFSELQLDRISPFGTNNNSSFDNTLAGKPGTLSGHTLYSSQNGVGGGDVDVLLASNPSVSGMATPGDGIAGGEGFLLTVVTRGQLLNQVLKIIASHGGEV